MEVERENMGAPAKKFAGRMHWGVYYVSLFCPKLQTKGYFAVWEGI
jgi:hypothetical protein